ncbi:MAG TPA: LuxR family transcriptional regulator [Actinokineospora sp.]|nr:LuxR family transcriptional regulator [Actinokineospora sp.]
MEGRSRTRVVGRAGVLRALRDQLADGGGALLTGPSGIGKTTLLDEVAEGWSGTVLRATSAENERWIPGTALADLFAQVPTETVAALPDPQRRAVVDVLSGERIDAPGAALRMAWHSLLLAMAAETPVLVLLDDVQWIDATSADILAYAARRLPGGAVRVVVAGRVQEPLDLADDGDGADPRPVAPSLLVPRPLLRLPVPPLTADDLAELFDAYGLPARTAVAIHADSEGNPYLALTLAGAFSERTGLRAPAPLPPGVAALVHERLAGVAPRVRQTLLLCALATRPTIRLLLRAGRADARHDIRHAVQAGLVVTDEENIRFTPPAAASIVADLADAERRAQAHRELADAVTFDDQRDRHLALASAAPDAQVARALVVAAETAIRRGSRDLAAELYLLAADRAPADLSGQRLEWLVSATEAAANAGLPEQAGRAAQALLAAADARPLLRVRVRMALLHVAGQGFGGMKEVFAAALADAGDDPASRGLLCLWESWAAMVASDSDKAVADAERAVELARSVGDHNTEALAAAAIALQFRVTGRPDSWSALGAALALPAPDIDGWTHMSPRYFGTRFAIFDDRLDDARSDLLDMLALVEHGAAEELVHVLRSLSEVSVGLGRCQDALTYADRALRIAGEARMSPGPCWHAAAEAELAGGSIGRAIALAERGIRASEQESDGVFIRRHLHVLGQGLLRSGQPAPAVVALRRIAASDHGDPSILRWHGDLAAAHVFVGEYDEAERVLKSTRSAIDGRPHTDGVRARLDRAESGLRHARGDSDSAIALLDQATAVLTDLGQPLEIGKCHLMRGRIERHRRRFAPARAALDAAHALFVAAHAVPWATQTDALRSRLDGSDAPAATALQLTSGESRIAELVAEGATNKEVADRLFVSVKTVEATLTRLYRKLGVRSRTQLIRLLRDQE